MLHATSTMSHKKGTVCGVRALAPCWGGRVRPQEQLLAGMLKGGCTYRGLLEHCVAAPVRAPHLAACMTCGGPRIHRAGPAGSIVRPRAPAVPSVEHRAYLAACCSAALQRVCAYATASQCSRA